MPGHVCMGMYACMPGHVCLDMYAWVGDGGMGPEKAGDGGMGPEKAWDGGMGPEKACERGKLRSSTLAVLAGTSTVPTYRSTSPMGRVRVIMRVRVSLMIWVRARVG